MKASLDHQTHPAQLAEGSMLTDRLIIVRRLGSGGMGDVYEVEHRFTKHRRAAKVLHAQFQHNDEVVERFLREASAAGRIGNPHIVETFDAGHLADGSPFLVMEFLDGKPLGDVLRWNGRLDVGLASAVMRQVCTAVQAAHDANIIHRDLKPENLFLTERDGRAFMKVLDFGISKFQGDEGPEVRSTRSGITMGTPLYMAPEQLRGAKNADARSDVYSLGVILYEMLIGSAPFVADSFAELAVKVLTAEARPIHLVDGALPQQMSQIVSRAIAKDPAQRFQSARQLGEALEPFARNCSVSVLLQHDTLPADAGPRVDSDTYRAGAAPVPATPVPATPVPAAPVPETASPTARRPGTGSTPAPVSPGVEPLRPSELHSVAPKRRLPVVMVALTVCVVAAVVFWTRQGGEVSAPPPSPEPPKLVAPEAVAAAVKTSEPVAPPVKAPEPPPIVPESVTPAPTDAAAKTPPPVPKTASPKTRSPKTAAKETLTPPPMPPQETVAPALGSGLVDLACNFTNPAGQVRLVSCRVQVDGQDLGETPVLGAKVTEGMHSFVFTNSETSQVKKLVITVSAGQRLRVPVSW